MSDFIFVITQSVVQALTEFFPVSSSGHLLISKHLFGLKNPGLLLDLVLHLGSTAAIVIYLFKQRKDLITRPQDTKKLVLYACLGTFVTGIVGLFLAPYVRSFYSLTALASNYFIIGTLLLASKWIDRYRSRDRDLSDMRWVDALYIGLLQGVSIFPGISRSGITIIGMLMLGFGRKFSFYFAFVLAVPTIIAATGFEFIHEIDTLVAMNLKLVVLGFFLSAGLSYPLLSVLKKVIHLRLFYVFGLYCLLVSMALLFFYD